MRLNNSNKTPQEQFVTGCKTALNIIGYRDTNENTLRDKLAMRGYEKDMIDRIVEKIKSMGYLNEKKSLENTVDYLSRVKKYGPMRIKPELVKKKFSREYISMVDFSKEPYCDIDFVANCVYVIQKRGGIVDDKTKAYLQRYGYTFDIIKQAIKVIEEDE